MSKYNNYYVLFLGEYQIHALYPFKNIIIASKWIHFTQFIDRIENNDFIHDTSNIRIILLIGSKLLNNGCINKQWYEKLWKNLFLEKLQNLLQNGESKWCLSTFVLLLMMWKNTTNHLTAWLKLEIKLHRKPNKLFLHCCYLHFLLPYCLHTYVKLYCIQHVTFLMISVFVVF